MLIGHLQLGLNFLKGGLKQKVILHDKGGRRGRPSKCPTFYTNRILGEQNLRQKVGKFCQNLNYDNMTFLFKYSLTVPFSIPQERLPWVN